MHAFPTRIRFTPVTMLLALAACGMDAPMQPVAQEDRLSMAAMHDATSLAGDMVVSTNEPFWQVRVEAGRLHLDGLNQDQPRDLDIVEDVQTAGTRQVVAGDVEGQVKLWIEARACEDSMSGAGFPHSARLMIGEDETVTGCARPASMPPPRESGD